MELHLMATPPYGHLINTANSHIFNISPSLQAKHLESEQFIVQESWVWYIFYVVP